MKHKARSQARYLGRRSGLPHAVRVRCAKIDEGLVMRVSRPEHRRWWRNFLTPWPITVVEGDRLVHATGEVVAGASDDGRQLAAAYFESFPIPPRHARGYDADRLLFVRARPCSTGQPRR